MADREYVHHWRHGWIPLDHAAAMMKAHGSRQLAEKYRRRYFPRRTASHVLAYREARQAQNARYENHARLSHSDTKRPEYAEYFGLGEYEGRGQEKRVTYRDWIKDLSREKEHDRRGRHAYREAVKLGRRHARAGLTVEQENAEYDAGERTHGADHADTFGMGYAEGLQAEYERQTRRRARPSNPLVEA